MVIFHSYVKLPDEGIQQIAGKILCFHGSSSPSELHPAQDTLDHGQYLPLSLPFAAKRKQIIEVHPINNIYIIIYLNHVYVRDVTTAKYMASHGQHLHPGYTKRLRPAVIFGAPTGGAPWRANATQDVEVLPWRKSTTREGKQRRSSVPNNHLSDYKSNPIMRNY